ncbi:hypothetical protein C5167_008572 [Papaver somniferum]|uniref:Uncharacterized protein n=1 Tax=Papaver somniferum TaxID=3469 RepID=A0A4Y7JUX5_PAPSO|nr:hypothetical protein C5167_008572 [Papaver somniferum]
MRVKKLMLAHLPIWKRSTFYELEEPQQILRVVSPVSPFEYQSCEKYKLAKAEKLNIIKTLGRQLKRKLTRFTISGIGVQTLPRLPNIYELFLTTSPVPGVYILFEI